MIGNVADFFNKLQPLDTAISLLNTVLIVMIFLVVTFGKKYRIKKTFQALRREPGVRPAILIVDLVENADMAADVERFRLSIEALKDIPPERIFRIERSKALKEHDLIQLVNELRMTKRRFSEEAVDVVHLFYGGPTTVPALIGAEMVNFCRVVLYQKNAKESTWNNWGPLRHGDTL